MSGLMQQTMYQLGVRLCKSSAYHLESQGVLERFHQTLKNMIRVYFTEYSNDWDQEILLLLFATREVIQESLCFGPFELVFGQTVCGPLKLLKELWLAEDTSDNLLDQVADLRYRLIRANELVKINLVKSQNKMKVWYDKKARKGSFKVGDKVRTCSASNYSTAFTGKVYCGPYIITRKVSDVDYVIATPDRRKSQRLCHISMLKEYQERNPTTPAEVTKQLPITSNCLIQDIGLNMLEREREREIGYD